MYIFSVIKQSLSLFSKKQKLSFCLLMVFFLFSALIQVIGIASIGPFIALLSDPEIIQRNKIFSLFYNQFEFSTINEFIMAVAICSLSVMVFSNIISALTLWMLMRFSIAIGGDIQIKLFENLLHRDYLFHKSSNYSDSIAIINQEAPRFVYMVMQPILLFLSNLFIAIIILLGLIFLNPLIAILTGMALGLTYLVTYVLLKKSLKKHGDVLTERNSKVQKILSESFVGIKEVKLNRLQRYFISQFENINSKGLNSTSFITLSGDIPKFVIETVAFSVIFIAAIVKLMYESDVKSIVPILSIYAIAGYKLLPTMQQIYKSISTISAHGSVPFVLSNELQTISNTKNEYISHNGINVARIELRDVSFKYPSAKDITLDGINITFFNKEINTIAGHSGSGKSTLVDILLGLIRPDKGKIWVNNKEVDEIYLANLQRSCGYVPQQIFILDDSIVANIAFGVDKSVINESEIIQCLKMANAWEFVENLSNGIHTQLGQDGKLLSGGQRQKIGIARALYRKPQVLILDEPTSALDIESEYDFMMLLRNLKSHVLIIVVSHRPSAIKCSDSITIIDHGKVESSGSLDELKRTSPTFIRMLEKSSFD